MYVVAFLSHFISFPFFILLFVQKEIMWRGSGRIEGVVFRTFGGSSGEKIGIYINIYIFVRLIFEVFGSPKLSLW